MRWLSNYLILSHGHGFIHKVLITIGRHYRATDVSSISVEFNCIDRRFIMKEEAWHNFKVALPKFLK